MDTFGPPILRAPPKYLHQPWNLPGSKSPVTLRADYRGVQRARAFSGRDCRTCDRLAGAARAMSASDLGRQPFSRSVRSVCRGSWLALEPAVERWYVFELAAKLGN